MLPSNSTSSRCENEAFVPGFPQISSLPRSSSNAESVWTHAKHNSTASSKNRENHVEPSVSLRAHFELEPATPATVAHASLLFTAPEAPFTRKKHNVSSKSSHSNDIHDVQKCSYRAMLPSHSKTWRCENDAFVRGICHIPRVEDTKAKLSCDASFKFQQLKMWNRSFRAILPTNLDVQTNFSRVTSSPRL